MGKIKTKKRGNRTQTLTLIWSGRGDWSTTWTLLEIISIIYKASLIKGNVFKIKGYRSNWGKEMLSSSITSKIITNNSSIESFTREKMPKSKKKSIIMQNLSRQYQMRRLYTRINVRSKLWRYRAMKNNNDKWKRRLIS